MDQEILALIVRAKDEASSHFNNIERSLGSMAAKADVAGRAMDGLHSVMGGVAAGLGIAAFQSLEDSVSRLAGLIPDLVNKGLAFAGTVDTIQNATGASAEAASRLAGEMQYLGIGTDGLGLKMGTLAKGIMAHEAELTRLGVSIRGANGDYLDGVTIVDRVRSALSGMADGVQKTRLATELFGKSGADMIDWLNLSDKQAALLDGQLNDLGVTMNQSAVEEAKKATREGNLFNLAMQGLGNTLMTNVAPAVTQAIDTMVSFVRAHGREIAQFASEVINFVLGMVSAIVGGTAPTVNFADAMAHLGDSAGGAADKLGDIPPASNAAAGAYAKLSQEIQRQIDKVKALESAQESQFQKEMGQLTAQLDAQTAALDAADKAKQIAERRAQLAADVANAADPQAMAAAQKAQADYEAQLVEDARRDQIASVKAKVEEIASLEKDATNKVALDRTLKNREKDVEAQIEVARAQGDAQSVADLQIVLQALQTADARTQQAIRNGDRESDLQKQKAQIDALKAAISSVNKPIKDLGDTGSGVARTLLDHASMVGGYMSGGMLKSIEDARKAGEDMGVAIRNAIDMATTAVGKAVDAVGGLSAIIGAIDRSKLGLAIAALGVVTGQPEIVVAGLIMAGMLAGGGGATTPTGTTSMNDWIGKAQAGVYNPSAGAQAGRDTDKLQGRATGGSVLPGGVYRVGERGPETLVMGKDAGTVQPSGTGSAGGPVTVSVQVSGAAVFDPFGVAAQQVAQALLPGLRRELTRQGVSLG